MIEEKLNKFISMEASFKLSDFHHQWHLIVPSAMKKKTEDLNTEELAEQEFEKFGSYFKQLPAFRRKELIGDFYKMCNGYYRLAPAGVTSLVSNLRGRPAMQFPGATKTLTKRDMSRFEVEDAIAEHKKHWEEHDTTCIESKKANKRICTGLMEEHKSFKRTNSGVAAQGVTRPDGMVAKTQSITKGPNLLPAMDDVAGMIFWLLYKSHSTVNTTWFEEFNHEEGNSVLLLPSFCRNIAPLAWGDWNTLMDCISVVCKLIPNAGAGGSWIIGLVEEKDQSNQEYSGKTFSGLKIPSQEIGASKLQQDDTTPEKR
ncbi:hypothetical protein PPACK8108_LOCUS24534 [Phakopsora pachyrhizi]|uniref:Uncharacterized protein n=1 Tax=Phakopsora pachyrhizi TaxID=170000 RepID=A0AAV0BQ26_PHAPC|nr:hypothetical protein PPACK8108_LOCUS24534 [Phakopsora pachyrhizi]